MYPRPTTALRPATPARAGNPIPRFVGWLLVVPAGLLFIVSYVIPTVDLLQDTGWGRGTGGYLTSSAYLGQVGHALSFALIPVLILVTVAPAFAWAASRAGVTGRWAARAALALPLAAFAPAGLAAAWINEHLPADPFGGWGDADSRLVMVATMSGFLFAVPVTCYLCALRRREPGARTWPATVIVGAVLAVVAVALAVQQYVFVALIDGPPIGEFRQTPMGLLELIGAPGAAAVPITLLPVLAGLGIAAAVVIVGSGLRVEFDPAVRSADDRAATPAVRTIALAGTVAGVAALLAYIGFQLGPWLSTVVRGEAELPGGFSAGSVFASTWLVPLGTAIIQVGAAALAAFGIAVVRPAGRGSEWLLLVVAPWLLVGNGLLAASRLDTASDGPLPLLAYAPPSLLSLPALFVFTMVFRGQAAAWWRLRAGGVPAAFPRAMWPALPMLVLATGVAWLLQAQDLLVPSMADRGQGVVPNGQLLLARAAIPFPGPDAPALGYPLILLVLFTLGGLALQLAYLDRVAIRIGPTGPVQPAPAGPGYVPSVPAGPGYVPAAPTR